MREQRKRELDRDKADTKQRWKQRGAHWKLPLQWKEIERRGCVTRIDRDGCIHVRENMKNRNICKTARKRWRCAESERSRGKGKTERNGRRVYTRDRERVEGRQRVCERRQRVCAVGLCVEADEGEGRYAGAREYVTGMARGQLTFIILTLMDYLIPYIPTDPSQALLLLLLPLRYVSRHPPQSSAKYRIIFMDVFKLMHQGVRCSNNKVKPESNAVANF